MSDNYEKLKNEFEESYVTQCSDLIARFLEHSVDLGRADDAVRDCLLLLSSGISATLCFCFSDESLLRAAIQTSMFILNKVAKDASEQIDSDDEEEPGIK